MIPEESEHLLFEKLYSKGKTDKYRVLLKPYNNPIGEIKWQWKWRQYAFFINPVDDLAFDLAVINEIQRVFTVLMDQMINERKKKG